MSTFPHFRVKFIGRLDSWNVTWRDVEELRYEIDEYNMDVKLLEYFSTLERQDAFDAEELPEELELVLAMEELGFVL